MKIRTSLFLSVVTISLAGAQGCAGDDETKPLGSTGDGDGDMTGDGDGSGGGDGDGTGGGDGDATGGTVSLGGMGGDPMLGGAPSSGGDPGTGGDPATGGDMNMGGMPPLCGGTADACDTYSTSATCATQAGCFTNGVCSDPGGGTDCAAQTNGTDCVANNCEWFMPCQPSVDCSTLLVSSPCNLQQGCEWDPSGGGECIVKETNGCIDITLQAACTTTVGCDWAQEAFTCGGSATSCDVIDVAECDSQAGCSVQ